MVTTDAIFWLAWLLLHLRMMLFKEGHYARIPDCPTLEPRAQRAG